MKIIECNDWGSDRYALFELVPIMKEFNSEVLKSKNFNIFLTKYNFNLYYLKKKDKVLEITKLTRFRLPKQQINNQKLLIQEKFKDNNSHK